MLFIKQIKCHFIIRYVSVGFLCWFGKCRRCVSICVALPVTNAFVNQNCKLTCSVHYTGCITANLRICIWSKRRIKRNTTQGRHIHARAHTHALMHRRTLIYTLLTHARTHTHITYRLDPSLQTFILRARYNYRYVFQLAFEMANQSRQEPGYWLHIWLYNHLEHSFIDIYQS